MDARDEPSNQDPDARVDNQGSDGVGSYDSRPEHPHGALVLGLGIAGLVGVPLAPLIGLIVSQRATPLIGEPPRPYKPGGIFNVGRVLSIIGTILQSMTAVIVVVMLIWGGTIISGILAGGDQEALPAPSPSLSNVQGSSGATTIGSESASPQGKRGSIRFAFKPDRTGQVVSLVNEWNQAHPGEVVEMVELSDNADERRHHLMTNLRTDGSLKIDVMPITDEIASEFSAHGWLKTLTPGEFPTAGMFEPAVKSLSVFDRLVAYPYEVDAPFVLLPRGSTVKGWRVVPAGDLVGDGGSMCRGAKTEASVRDQLLWDTVAEV